MRIGVIAYGSLVYDPGRELEDATAERRYGLRTPFRVEFARSSKNRGGAPTLVPVAQGGGYVECVLLVLKESCTLNPARDMVYRREKSKVGDESVKYLPNPSNSDQVYIEIIPDWGGADYALYTRIQPNISQLNPEKLAELAIQSVSTATRGKDGVSYLLGAMRAGVRTPLTEDYVGRILAKTATDSLTAALEQLTSLKNKEG